MQITVMVEGLAATRAYLAGQARQVGHAAAVALTRTAGDVKAAIPEALDKALDKPTPFTRGGTFVRKATRALLTAVVGFRPRQAEYMRYQIEGGTRDPGSRGLKLPSAIKVNDFGNIPRGLIAKMIAAARKEKGITRATGKRIRVSAKLDLFYGDPEDVGVHKFPRGIYKDVDLGGGRRQLIPLIVFPVHAARYTRRFNFEALAERIVKMKWRGNFDTALVEALRTAR